VLATAAMIAGPEETGSLKSAFPDAEIRIYNL
jgi:hypothetical protein